MVLGITPNTMFVYSLQAGLFYINLPELLSGCGLFYVFQYFFQGKIPLFFYLKCIDKSLYYDIIQSNHRKHI